MNPANDLANQRRRTNRARHTFVNTCPASRTLHGMANDLIRYGRCYAIEEDPTAAAATLLSVLESLWKARSELARLNRE